MSSAQVFEKGWDDLAEGGKYTNWMEGIEWFDWGNDKVTPWLAFRPVGGVLPMARHSIEVAKSHKRFSMFCYNFDSRTEKFLDNGCLCCACDAKHSDGRGTISYAQKIFYLNIIDRQVQKRGGTRIVRLLELTKGCMEDIKALREFLQINPETNKPYPIAHPQFGCDIMVKYNGNAETAGDYYKITKGDLTALTQTEMAFIKEQSYDLVTTVKMRPMKEMVEALQYNGYLAKATSIPEGPTSLGSVSSAPPIQQPVQVPQQVAVQPTVVQTPVQQVQVPVQLQVPVQPTIVQTPVQQVQTPVQQVQVQAPVQPTGLVPTGTSKKPDNCPTDFGKYGGKMVCLRCPVRPDCIKATTVSGA